MRDRRQTLQIVNFYHATTGALVASLDVTPRANFDDVLAECDPLETFGGASVDVARAREEYEGRARLYPYRIELANKIRNGRAVGDEWIVTLGQIGRTGELARFATREEAAAWIQARLTDGE